MKRIGLISDTHSYIDDRIVEYFLECDEIWHAGDIGTIEVVDKLKKIAPLRAVYGNIDNNIIRSEYPKHNRFILEGVDVWITHIGGKPYSYNYGIRQDLIKNTPKLFICGHSHICRVQMDKSLNMLYMNPGAAGIHGFHKIRTIIRFTLDKGNIKDLEVVELGKRV